ncbi:TIGR02452 family protein [Butyrivibrio fibrisolvens]|uniref:TIGR02452 family protein n=1 Tax=Butyrivibrio fibrisolvens TaxID=831 RepID=A0A317FWP2_BUTFI|nr:TIGR02452 family protein [Butyrivibrio fibrisolvens]PWT25667.1 TIGR02452 family protein [Butyrivibrio fibrisolvens]PWT29053.1 TIGR02452 family protein [Butyrivibrio fibrisolvens]
MGRNDNVAIFQDTEKMCRENVRLRESIKQASENQKLILEGDLLFATEKDKYDESAKIVVSKKKTFEAASAYKGMKVAVHNFASATNPGGGVVKGSTAQEECLCRCSTLYSMLNVKEMWNEFYAPHRNAADPIHNDDIIYTPGVVVFKTDTAAPVVMPETQWYEVDIITCAAPNLRDNPSNPYNKNDGNRKAKISDRELLELHEKRLKRILDVAVDNDDEVVILGAFGCGAFQNKPDIVAKAASNVIGDFLHLFKNIEFAVYCSPRDSRNYDVFKRLLANR